MKRIIVLHLLLFPLVYFCRADSNLTISEVMFNAPSGNNEFIELYNLSSSESINLNGYKIKYYTSSADGIIGLDTNLILLPNSYAVILEGDYDFEKGIYNNIIPSSALLLKIDNNSFGSSGMANTTDRPVYLLNAENDTVNSYVYSANNSSGYSDEKIIMNTDNSSVNWKNSLYPLGTPGFKNSVCQKFYDLTISSFTFSPNEIFQNENVNIEVGVKNIGVEPAGSFTLEIYSENNYDSIAVKNEKIYSEIKNNLLPNDSSIFTTTLFNLQGGKYQLIAKIIYTQDEDSLNNIGFLNFAVHPPPNNFNDVVINEIMYAPSTGQPEWVELYNKTNAPVNLNKWRFHDNSSHVNITSQDNFIPANGFVVLCKDTTIKSYFNVLAEIIPVKLPSLNNTGDIACIRDSSNITIDSLEYLPTWGGSTNGRSLERILINRESIQAENWGTSKSKFKATPGKVNSLTPKNYDLGITNFETEKEYAIIGEKVLLRITIKNAGLNPSATFIVNIYKDPDADSTIKHAEMFISLAGDIIYPGDSTILNYATSDFSTGKNYFIAELITEPDDEKENNISYTYFTGAEINEVRNDLIINEIMFAPASPEPEWIEIFNRSMKNINLKNYQIADASDTIKIINYNLLINPEEYLVIAKDSSITNKYPINSKIIFTNFPSLNNSADKIILLDSLNRAIDSLQYSSKWGGTNGRSLERISADNLSIDSLNWKSCKSKIIATPGKINSVTKKDFDLELSRLFFKPELPVIGDSINISAVVKNAGKQITQFYLQLYRDTDLDSLPDKFLEESQLLNLQPNDSTSYTFQYLEINIRRELGYAVKIISEPDQDTTNNTFYKKILPGYLPSTITVNEIMYLPQGGEPEWIEVYNTTSDSVNLKDWTVTDIYTTPLKSKITTKNVFVPPNKYLVLSRDTSINLYHRYIQSQVVVFNLPVLNNDEDGIILKDSREVTVDSAHYNKNWGGMTGYSIERKSYSRDSNTPANWGPSKDLEMSTPGRINSITEKKYDLSFVKISSVPEYPVPGDDIFIKVKIANNGNYPAENFKIQFYFNYDSISAFNFLGELSNLSINANDTLCFTSNESLMNIQTGFFAKANITFTADEDTLNNSGIAKIETGYSKNSVLINEVMYDPSQNEPEWFEIVNASPEAINLVNWKVKDFSPSANKQNISSEDLIIDPGEFIVITRDTSLFKNYYKNFSGKLLKVNFGSLGNSEDGIVIYDFRNAPIDSLYYKSSWGTKKGSSLERVSLDKTTTDSTNWMCSLNNTGSTPGEKNSVIDLKSYEGNSLIINEIMFDPAENNSEFVEFLNTSNDSVDVGGWRLYQPNGSYNMISDISRIIPNGGFFLLAADSSIYENYNWLKYSYCYIANKSDLSLSNSEDKITLKDAKGNTIDSVFYSSKWHNKNFLVTKNKSLERINPLIISNNPENWSTAVCAEGATPGKSNSIFVQNQNLEENISVSPNPFSPDNDGFEDFTVINYNLKQITAQVRIKIFDSQGRLVRTLLNNEASGSSGSVIFNGLSDSGNALRIGIYIIFLEALNENSGVLETMKTVVVVARKL